MSFNTFEAKDTSTSIDFNLIIDLLPTGVDQLNFDHLMWKLTINQSTNDNIRPAKESSTSFHFNFNRVKLSIFCQLQSINWISTIECDDCKLIKSSKAFEMSFIIFEAIRQPLVNKRQPSSAGIRENRWHFDHSIHSIRFNSFIHSFNGQWIRPPKWEEITKKNSGDCSVVSLLLFRRRIEAVCSHFRTGQSSAEETDQKKKNNNNKERKNKKKTPKKRETKNSNKKYLKKKVRKIVRNCFNRKNTKQNSSG